MKDCPFESSSFEWSCLGHPVIPTAEGLLQRDARLGGAGGWAHHALCPQHWAAQRTVLACVGFAGHSAVVLPPFPPWLSLSFLAVSAPNAGVPFHFRCYSVWGHSYRRPPSAPSFSPSTWIHHPFPNSLHRTYIHSHLSQEKGGDTNIKCQFTAPRWELK